MNENGPKSRNQSARILVLDDDEKIGDLILESAAREAFAARYVGNPWEFLEAIDTWMPTHVILALRMRHMDGIEVISKLARADGHLSRSP
ncbi:MAG: hypothetical protein P4K86_13790 [Terracidiphilus sp.]|nr:hypothetical protein [Terracidiphilus sp.]MDR3777325.1 hypothetical protein [Terracidiphilus sp.]